MKARIAQLLDVRIEKIHTVKQRETGIVVLVDLGIKGIKKYTLQPEDLPAAKPAPRKRKAPAKRKPKGGK